MGDFPLDTTSFPPVLAILWVFYPMAVLVGIELFTRAIDDDDDDDNGDGGVMTPVYQGV
tara:strand:- start:173 stop:349 length:177 start_codon:yes stop_codon:yes gene_type:complete